MILPKQSSHSKILGEPLLKQISKTTSASSILVKSNPTLATRAFQSSKESEAKDADLKLYESQSKDEEGQNQNLPPKLDSFYGHSQYKSVNQLQTGTGAGISTAKSDSGQKVNFGSFSNFKTNTFQSCNNCDENFNYFDENIMIEEARKDFESQITNLPLGGAL